MKEGQMWSVDVIIGVVIFLSIILVFYSTMTDTGEDIRELLEANADKIVSKFSTDPDVRVIGEGNTLNMTRLEELATTRTYEQLKEDFGVTGDFCIYVEDQAGRIVPIGSKSSIGKGDINISGKACGSTI